MRARSEPRSRAARIWTRHKAVITVTTAVVIVTALVAGVLLALRGGGQAGKASATRPAAPRLLSPFTGEPVASLNRVLAEQLHSRDRDDGRVTGVHRQP